MGDKMRGRAGRRRHHEEREEARPPESARHWRAERDEPQQVEDQMIEIGVDQRIGDEGPDPGAPPARQQSGREARIITRGQEGEQQQDLGRLLLRQREHEYRVDQTEHGDQDQHDDRYVEDGLAGGFHGTFQASGMK